LRETSDTWVNVLGLPRWLADGSFLWRSERTGYAHLYHHAADGSLLGALTEGEWSVAEILRVDEDAGQVWLTANRDGALDVNAYRVGLDGQGLVRLTHDPGTHAITISPDGSRFVDVFSSLAEPPELRLCLADGTVAGVLQVAPVPALSTLAFGRRQLHRLPSRDGFALDVSLLLPPDFDPDRRYPVYLDVYGGPGMPSFTNEWNAGADPFHQFLAQQGILVLQVNNRTAAGRGQRWTGACYKSLGASELRDFEDAVAWLCQRPWADAARVAIAGWSFGGTMAAYALTHSGAFALGIAGAGVYDWRLYDSIYTERYMDTPQRNPEGYRQSSSVAAAADLRGHLLLVHGTMDDNVHVQSTMQMVYALQQAGKDFELMLYPRARHGVEDAGQSLHLRRLEWRAIQRYLLR
jgi:dipeptidyl-peptidase-4